MATTTDGWPYVVPADHPLEYPAVSQQLATLLESRARIIGGVAQLSGSVASNASGTSNLPFTGTPETWGGVTVTGVSIHAPRAGLYELSLNVTIPTNGAGTVRSAWLILGGIDAVPAGYANIGATAPPSSSTGGTGMLLSASGIWRIPQGVGAICRARHDAGSALTVTGSLTLRYIRD